MNLKSGLLRLWLVASATWMTAMLGLAGWSWWNYEWRVVSVEGEWPTVSQTRAFFAYPETGVAVAWGVAVPVAVLVLGLGLAWVIRGFRSTKAA